VADSVSSPRRAGRQRQRRGGWASVARRRSVSGLWRLAGPAAPRRGRRCGRATPVY